MTKESGQAVMISGKYYTAMDVIKSKDEYIRLEAVDKCFALRDLVNDSSALVRMAVARKGIGHDILVADASWRVRATVAKYSMQSDILDALVGDIHDFVRFVLVKRRYALELFLQDADEEIAAIARRELKERCEV